MDLWTPIDTQLRTVDPSVRFQLRLSILCWRGYDLVLTGLLVCALVVSVRYWGEFDALVYLFLLYCARGILGTLALILLPPRPYDR